MVKMSPRLKEFCDKQELMRLAYIECVGYPRVVPLWFIIKDNDYFFGTGATSPKAKALQRNARAGWTIDGGEDRRYLGVSFTGHAEEISDAELRATIYEALGVKYFGSSDHEKFVEVYGKVDDPATAYYRLKPEGGRSWEY
jgi:nitroimidazol reductase NimA-like FMN-containing flavoprotein (pyridoxamine 5'-phosphate oxidase superfamily)